LEFRFFFFFFNTAIASLLCSSWHLTTRTYFFILFFLSRGDHAATPFFADVPLEAFSLNTAVLTGSLNGSLLLLLFVFLLLPAVNRSAPHSLHLYNLPANLNNIFINPRGFFFNFLEKWVFTTNHKRVGINYMWYAVIAGVVATFFATVIKLELGEPGSLYCGGNMRIYLSVVTGHAVIMVFLTYVPIYYGAFTNYLIPIQLGARDFAYPRLNNFSFWVFPPALFFFVSALLKHQGLLTGWTFYPPLSGRKYSPDFNMDITILSIVLIAVGSLISTSNLISTFRYMRGASLKADYRYIPLSVYGTLFGAVLFTMVAPVLGVAMVMLYLDRHGITNYFNVSKGGDVVLYQHIFWFFGHPEVYVLILPTFGYVSNIVVFSAKQNILTYDHMVISMFAICLLGMIVWGHHMYVGGLNRGMKNMFSATSLFVSIPSTLKIHS
jgi:heme/copper-type cytochrome/quinol oxidase subunit 1